MKRSNHLAILTAIGTLSLLSAPVYAAQANTTSDSSTVSPEKVEQLIANINSQEASLQSEVKYLKKEVKQLKQEQNVNHPKLQSVVYVSGTPQQQKPLQGVMYVTGSPQPMPVQINIAPSLGTSIQPNGARPVTGIGGNLPAPFFTGLPVYTAAYIGDHTAFDPSALVIYYPSYNEDLHLLQQKATLFSQYAAAGIPAPTSPFLQVSGKLEAQAIYSKPFTGAKQTNIALATTELDFIPVINDWASGFAAFAYDNSLAPNGALTSNSRIYLDTGFLTIGNLNAAPVYMTIGQMYVPFGAYLSNMITDPLTMDLGQIKDRALLFGYQHPGNEGLYAEGFVFNGDSGTSTNDVVNDGGANIGYAYNSDAWNFDLGGSYINNIADSIFMQDTGAPTTTNTIPSMPAFGGYAEGTSNDVIIHMVPAYDVHGSLGIGNFGFVAEYVTASRPFNTMDLTFDGHGAEPKAFNFEGNYSFPTFGKPSAITIGYGNSRQALAINIPETRYIAAYTISFWRNTVEELEFRHDINYASGDTATGNGQPVNTQGGLGGNSNTVTAQIGIYF